MEINRHTPAQAARIRDASTPRDTINASQREIIDAQRRLELLALLSEPGRFDFHEAEDAWGGDG